MHIGHQSLPGAIKPVLPLADDADGAGAAKRRHPILDAAIAAQLTQGSDYVKDLTRRSERFVLWFHQFVFTGHLWRANRTGGRTPEMVIAGMGTAAGEWFRKIEAACFFINTFSDNPSSTWSAVPTGWDYTIHDDGRVTLIEPAVEPFELVAR